MRCPSPDDDDDRHVAPRRRKYIRKKVDNNTRLGHSDITKRFDGGLVYVVSWPLGQCKWLTFRNCTGKSSGHDEIFSVDECLMFSKPNQLVVVGGVGSILYSIPINIAEIKTMPAKLLK